VQENYLGGLVQDLALGYLNKSLRLITGHSPSIALCFAARNATTYTYLCDGSFRYGFGEARVATLALLTLTALSEWRSCGLL
jgi:hypothetical protein